MGVGLAESGRTFFAAKRAGRKSKTFSEEYLVQMVDNWSCRDRGFAFLIKLGMSSDRWCFCWAQW